MARTKKKYAPRQVERHEWTKQEVMLLIQLWDNETIAGMAEKIGVTTNQIKAMAAICRKQGAMLSAKYVRGQRQAIVREALLELKIIKK